MKQRLQEMSLLFGRLDSRHIELIFVILTLSLFVLGAGAPAAGGGAGR